MSPLFSVFRNFTPEILSVLCVVREPRAAPKMYIDRREPKRCLCVNLSVYFFSGGSSLPPKQCLKSELCGSRTVLLESALSIPEKPCVATRAQHPFTGCSQCLWGTLWQGQTRGDRRSGTSGGSLDLCGVLQGDDVVPEGAPVSWWCLLVSLAFLPR